MQIDSDFKQMYNKSFQRLLLTHLVKDTDLFDKAESLEVEDFETTPCQVVWEATKDYVSKVGALPESDALRLHAQKVALNAEGVYKSYIKPEEGQAFLDLLQWIENTDPVNAAYFAEELPDFIKGIRTSKIMDEGRNAIIMGGQSDAIIAKLNKVKLEVDEKFAKDIDVFISPATNPGFLRQEDYVPPISCGLPNLDKFLGGGVNRGEVGLIQAPSGVGKTNLLEHMLLAGTYTRQHGLFFSLELRAEKVLGRYTAMASGIEAENLKSPVETWDDETWRKAAMTIKHNPAMTRAEFVDFSAHKPTTSELERRIAEWKTRKMKEGVPEDLCSVVCMDWIDYIRPPFVTKSNMEDWERYIMVAQELGFMARRNNVFIWVANQTTKEAERRQVARMGDTARGYHLHDAMDYSIGANIHKDDRPSEDNMNRGPQGSRKMVLTLVKNRNGDLGSFDCFRAPTLRMFDDEVEYYAYNNALLAASGWDGDAGVRFTNAQLTGLFNGIS